MMYSSHDEITEISYEPSKWCFDMLNLRNEEELEAGRIKTVQYEDLCPGEGEVCFDRVFAISLDVLMAVHLESRRIVTYHYDGQKFPYGEFRGEGGERWLDAVCAASYNRGNLTALYDFSLLILTEGGRLLLIELEAASNKLVCTHDMAINSRRQYTKILLEGPCQNQDPMQIYLWEPQRKILQQFELLLDQETAQPVPFTEFKIKNPKLDGKELGINGYDLTLSLDGENHSVLCADRDKHILFECGMRRYTPDVLCGQGIPGPAEEHVPTKQAYLAAPCAPMVYRPQDFVEKGRFTPSTKNILGVAEKGRPRLILVCDAGNGAVRKIWQFPNHPQALDLAGFDQINTLVGMLPRTGRYRPTLCRSCENPKALYVNPLGLLTVTMEHSAYVIAAYHVGPEQKTVSSQVQEGS